jgi:hypothetical protein
MTFKLFIFLAIIGFIIYRVNRAWLRFKKMVKEVTNPQASSQPKTKVIRKNDLTIIYPDKDKKQSKEFDGGEYVDFEEEK